LREALESHQWRAFRLFLVSLNDKELSAVVQQLSRERAGRRDCEHSQVRLFFSSLGAGDLELANQAISNERSARARERRYLASPAARRQRGQPASKSN